ncbi:MAG: hypothetical protein ACQEW9_16615 [Bacteroidota bacterium]
MDSQPVLFAICLAEGWEIPTNINIGASRAPHSNFIAVAEQSRGVD